MTKLTLVIMAAGASRRYGRLKQTEPVGPSGETLLEYSVYDALRAGFDKVVFIIRDEIAAEFKELVGHKLEGIVDVEYVLQEAGSMPQRQRPWGTGAALLSVTPYVTTPFGIINADDFYGRESFTVLAQQLSQDTSVATLVAFPLAQTLSGHGGVTRAICKLDEDGNLITVDETFEIKRTNGAVYSYKNLSQPVRLDESALVSLNVWGFNATVFEPLRQEWQRFIDDNTSSETAEFFIPTAVTNMIKDGRLTVKVSPSQANWFGLTHPEDRDSTVQRLQILTDNGTYPHRLWS